MTNQPPQMPQFPQIPAVPPPLQWGIGIGTLADGSKVCVLQLAQVQLAMTVQLSPHDMKRLAADIAKGATEAESGLIVPAGMTVAGLNGHNNH